MYESTFGEKDMYSQWKMRWRKLNEQYGEKEYYIIFCKKKLTFS